MSSNSLETKTHQVIDAYIRLLDKYSFEQLVQQPDENIWSIGQVYIHVWMASKGFFFKNAALCLSGETAVKGKSKKLIAYPIFLFEKMPTVKIKMPDKVAVQPRQPESKEQLVQKLTEIKSLVSEFTTKIQQSDSSLKTRHPFLGYLNCEEWVKLCNIHFKHHQAQIKRINKALHF